MSSGASGSDEKISASKIDPLASDQKYGVEHDLSSRGAAGSDRNIDQTRVDPVGGAGQYRHPDSKADSQGVVGRDEAVQGSKIEPLEGKDHTFQAKAPGLDDEQVDGSRINPLGEVREELA
ncbi:MAG: hypothetical protein M1821_002005 [Bathelium mastoideum]|nr:MAG: hypothetical protein M1821_002005 [Bathelium mastoideum]KAI9692511.1 MAG: hypothetical protein M1822_006742 [Bathelium mastoideum]